MKAHLLYPDRDFDWRWVLNAAAERDATRRGVRLYRDKEFNLRLGLPWNADALTADLALDLLFDAMAAGDPWVRESARRAILAAVVGDKDTVRHRQEILKDCIENPDIIRELYTVAVDAMEKRSSSYLGILTQYPDSVLRDAMETIEVLLPFLRKFRQLAIARADKFSAKGWVTFFDMIKHDLDETYLALLERHLDQLRFRHGELLSGALGPANKGLGYRLHRLSLRGWSLATWFTDLFAQKPPQFVFELHPRDEAGFRALGALRNRGIALAADALGQAADHVRDFIAMLRVELAFYVGCINIHDKLQSMGAPVCMPEVVVSAQREFRCQGLYELGLSLASGKRPVGNDTNGDGKDIIVITGPNNGGKSTFLRSIGLAQLMAQCGMFVPAEFLRISFCNGIFTHYKRQEDASMQSGKFDEELLRMNEIVDHVGNGALILFNESFASTNEREGSEIAWQIVASLRGKKIRSVFVTHMYELAHRVLEEIGADALFLRAERQVSGVRTYRLTEGEPLPTSFGEELYDRMMASMGKPAFAAQSNS